MPAADPERDESLLDRLVGEFADRAAAGGEPPLEDWLARVAPDHRPALERCLRMVRAGLVRAPRASAPLVPGSELDGHRIVRELGRGGMAVVYEAEQLALRRRVALKVLRPGLAIDPRHVERFQREALAVARLRHPHIVQVHAVGERDGHHWLAMELVEGASLEAVLARLPRSRPWSARDLHAAAGIPPPAEEVGYERALCALLAPLARALAVAHELGLLHRDVKPSNVLVQREGRALIADFGLAKGDGDPGLSLTGEPLGTPYYMSPEQAAIVARPVDQRSDVYSFGVMLYEALSGRRPFEGGSLLAVIEAIRARAAPDLRAVARERSRDAEAVVRRAMAFEPAERYASALDLAAELTALAEGRPTQALALEGGPLRRAGRLLRDVARGRRVEYRSPRTLLGLPLVHVLLGPRREGEPVRVAKGWLAVGSAAVGGVAVGGFAAGAVALGGWSCGLLALGGLALGALSLGGASVGLLAWGGVAVGWAAVGGYAVGHYALGGECRGAHVVTYGLRDPEAVAFWRGMLPFLALLPGGRHLAALVERAP